MSEPVLFVLIIVGLMAGAVVAGIDLGRCLCRDTGRTADERDHRPRP